jgi:hypothetical protein
MIDEQRLLDHVWPQRSGVPVCVGSANEEGAGSLTRRQVVNTRVVVRKNAVENDVRFERPSSTVMSVGVWK